MAVKPSLRWIKSLEKYQKNMVADKWVLLSVLNSRAHEYRWIQLGAATCKQTAFHFTPYSSFHLSPQSSCNCRTTCHAMPLWVVKSWCKEPEMLERHSFATVYKQFLLQFIQNKFWVSTQSTILDNWDDQDLMLNKHDDRLIIWKNGEYWADTASAKISISATSSCQILMRLWTESDMCFVIATSMAHVDKMLCLYLAQVWLRHRPKSHHSEVACNVRNVLSFVSPLTAPQETIVCQESICM
jgi:hypothetical protein